MRKILYMTCVLTQGVIMHAQHVQARPVSYPGGFTTMITNSGDMNALHLHYSPTINYSLGYKEEHWRDNDYSIQAVQVNNLLKRWNNPASQANLYLKSGVGAAIKSEETGIAIYSGLAMDWEDRRFFTSYENRYTKAGQIDNFFMQSVRVGVAPYIGEYNDLHTWLMLQIDHQPEANKNFSVTPLVRLFKGVHLFEAGLSNQGHATLNWVMRF